MAKANSPRKPVRAAAPKADTKDLGRSGEIPGGPDFPIVAIGASAGGLGAISELLMAIPPDSGMAFVVIQHLEPSHESAMASLLAKNPKMSVAEATHGLLVEPNSVYVIPPNRTMSIRGRALSLAPRRRGEGSRSPIDDF